MMVMVMGVMVVMLTRSQAQGIRSEQRRRIVRVRAAAQAQRVGSHEARGCRGRCCRYLWGGCDLFEQSDAVNRLIHGRTVASVLTRGCGCRCCRRGAQQRIQTHDVRLRRSQLRAHLLIVDPRFLEVVNEMATGPVRAETDRVEGAAQLGFVFRVAGKIAQFVVTVRELTFVAVFAGAALLERPAELGFIARRRLARATIQFTMLLDQGGYQGRVAATKGRVTAIVTGRPVTGRVRRCRGCFLRFRGSCIL